MKKINVGKYFFAAIVILAMIIPVWKTEFFIKTAQAQSGFSGSVMAEANAARKKNNLPSLAQSDKLQSAAQGKAEDMARKGYFSHTGPGGKSPWSWVIGQNYFYQTAGENLAVGYSSAGKVMGAWLNSSTHKSNLLSKNFTEAGVGIVKGKWKNKETYFIVQFYAKPKGAAPPAKYQAKDAKPPKITSIRISPENLKKYQLNIKLV